MEGETSGESLFQKTSFGLNTTYKITLIGRSGVGKTEIVNMFIKMITPEGHKPLVELSEQTTHLLDYTPVLGREICEKCDLLITTITPEELNTDELKRQEHGENADAHMIVVDLTDKDFLNHIDKIGKMVASFKCREKPLMVAANKFDLLEDGKINFYHSLSFCKEFHCAYSECSASTGFCITDIFNDLVEEVKRREHPDFIDPPQTPKIGGGCCC